MPKAAPLALGRGKFPPKLSETGVLASLAWTAMPVFLAALPSWISNLLPFLMVVGVLLILRKGGGT